MEGSSPRQPRSPELAPCGAGAAALELNLSVLALGERRESPGTGFVGWTGSKVFPGAGSHGVRTPTIGSTAVQAVVAGSEAVPCQILRDH